MLLTHSIYKIMSGLLCAQVHCAWWFYMYKSQRGFPWDFPYVITGIVIKIIAKLLLNCSKLAHNCSKSCTILAYLGLIMQHADDYVLCCYSSAMQIMHSVHWCLNQRGHQEHTPCTMHDCSRFNGNLLPITL